MRSSSSALIGIIMLSGCGSSPTSPTTCDLSKATTTMHTSLSGSETWASGIHVVPSTLTVPAGATLTIAACNKVQLAADAGFTVRGSLVVAGTSTAPVTFDPTTAGQPWGTIQLDPNGSADLSYATLTGAGGSGAPESSGVLGAAIYVHGSGGPPPPSPLKVSHVDIEQASGVGVALVNSGFAAGSDALTVKGAKGFPVYMGADVLDSLPAGAYTGNGADVIALQTAFSAGQDNQRPIIRDLTIHDRGVPYCVGMKDAGEIVIGAHGVAPPLVTIEPGVAIGFVKGASAGGRIRVLGETTGSATQALGAISAVGTAAKPIVFASCEATPAPGDWIGLMFNGVDPRTRLEAVGVSYAGADSGVIGVCLNNVNTRDGDAAVQILFQLGAPAASFITTSVISNSAASAIYRGWNGPDIDFTAGNMISGIAWCAQTLVPDASNACPATACLTAP